MLIRRNPQRVRIWIQTVFVDKRFYNADAPIPRRSQDGSGAGTPVPLASPSNSLKTSLPSREVSTYERLSAVVECQLVSCVCHHLAVAVTFVHHLWSHAASEKPPQLVDCCCHVIRVAELSGHLTVTCFTPASSPSSRAPCSAHQQQQQPPSQGHA